MEEEHAPIDPLKGPPKHFKDLISAAEGADLSSVRRLGNMAIRNPAPIPNQQQISKSMVDDANIGPKRKWAGYNEYLVALFDQLPQINGFFGLPKIEITVKGEEEPETKQEFVASEGNYLFFIKQAESKEELDKQFDTLAAQKYALLQIIMKAEDAHAQNILIRRNAEGKLIPIPIDYGRSLTHDPNDPTMIPRTTRWETWPQLKEPLDPTIVTFFKKLDPEQIVNTLREQFLSVTGELPEEMALRLDAKLLHLEVNLQMVKLAIESGLNARQILALILPAVTKFTFNYVTGGQLAGGSLWPARDKFIKQHTAFLATWSKSLHWRRFRMDTFLEKMGEEIEKIKKLTPEQLDEKYFHEICFELRRGLFL